MRLLFVTHYYAPEMGAPQTRLRETVRLAAAAGNDIRVLTNQPHYPHGRVQAGYRALSVRREEIDGVRILRLPVVARPNRGIRDRLVDQASFAFFAVAAIPIAAWADVLVVESPPLFLAATGRWLAQAAGRPYVLHVADPWPDYPIEIGALRNPLLIGLARAVERFAYAGAAHITTPTEGCAAVIELQAVARGKVSVVPNAVDVHRFRTDLTPAEARRTLGWPERQPTFVYAGTVGLAQGLQTLIEAVEIARASWTSSDHAPVVRVVGDGHDRTLVEDAATRLGGSLEFQGAVTADQIPLILAAADVILVLLKGGNMGSAALPTKLVEGMAAARPILLSAQGSAADIVRQAGAGVIVPAENPQALAAELTSILDRPQLGDMASAGRQLAIGRFSRTAAVAESLRLWRQAGRVTESST